jgi:exopolysaccharide biosynthesis polyprenyl glycosylphosphotransferase
MFAGEFRKQKVLFIVADALALLVALATALSLHDPHRAMAARLRIAGPELVSLSVTAIVLLWILVFRACNLYGMRGGGVKEFLGIVKGCSIAFLLTLGGDFLVHVQVSRITTVTAFALSIPLVAAGRVLTRACIRNFYANPNVATPLVVVGFNSVAHYLCDQIREQLTQYELLGFVDDNPEGRQFSGLPVLGKIDSLPGLAKRHPGLEAAIALPNAPLEVQERAVRLCEEAHVRWRMVPWLLRSPGGSVKVEILGVVPLIGACGSNLDGLNFAIKRSFDFVTSSVLLICLSPILALTALAVWFFDGSPILFRQVRVGIRGKSFEMLKFRTMRVASGDTQHRQYVQKWIRTDGAAAEHNGSNIYKLTDDNRITPLGRILRRFSLDELPQIFNVVRGDMSLIGPRPALPYETELYKSWHHRRLEVVPGITGLWQISGRNHLSFDEMVRLDVQYVENWSFTSDLRILARTLPVLLRGGGM